MLLNHEWRIDRNLRLRVWADDCTRFYEQRSEVRYCTDSSKYDPLECIPAIYFELVRKMPSPMVHVISFDTRNVLNDRNVMPHKGALGSSVCRADIRDRGCITRLYYHLNRINSCC